MGDSFTFGYGVSAARRWTALCGQMLGMELVNCAVSGNTTGGMLARLEYQMDRVKPGMVLLMGDSMISCSAAVTPPPEAIWGPWAILRQDGAPFLCSEHRPCPARHSGEVNGLADLEQVGEQAAVYQDWIRRMCGYWLPAAGSHQKLIRVAPGGTASERHFLDGLHMNEEGNRAIAEAAAPALRKIMER